MTVTDERLNQLANDPMMCNITPEMQGYLRELIALRAENTRLNLNWERAIREELESYSHENPTLQSVAVSVIISKIAGRL